MFIKFQLDANVVVLQFLTQTTDTNVSKRVGVGTGDYLKRIEGFSTWRNSTRINLIPVTVSK